MCCPTGCISINRENDIDPGFFFSSKNSLNIGYCLQYSGCINISKGNDIDPGCFFFISKRLLSKWYCLQYSDSINIRHLQYYAKFS